MNSITILSGGYDYRLVALSIVLVDGALYEAKCGGRDRVVVATPKAGPEVPMPAAEKTPAGWS
jgi:hypothetical protein